MTFSADEEAEPGPYLFFFIRIALRFAPARLARFSFFLVSMEGIDRPRCPCCATNTKALASTMCPRIEPSTTHYCIHMGTWLSTERWFKETIFRRQQHATPALKSYPRCIESINNYCVLMCCEDSNNNNKQRSTSSSARSLSTNGHDPASDFVRLSTKVNNFFLCK